MADALTALNSDVTVAYLDEARQKRIYYTGEDQKYTANQLYSALMDHFDEPARMDNPSPMSAQTPVEYTVGSIDAGDTDDPWYISYRLMEKITGGAIRTSGWARNPFPGDGTGTVGIVVAPVASGGTITYTDEGDTISHADGDSGTLLEFIDTGGATDYLVIRPDTNALADDFNSTTGTLTMGTSANTATQNAAAVTGEQIWANLYSIGTIEDDTHIYIYQGAVDGAVRARVYAQNSTTEDYWADGQIDICVPIRDYTSASAPVIDAGYLTVFARKSTTEYSAFEVLTSTTSGGRNPCPLGTKSDLNQTTGTGNFLWDNGDTGVSLADDDLLYNVGTTTAGNLDACVVDDGGTFTNETTDINDVGGVGDVPTHPSPAANNDAVYFGMNTPFIGMILDVNTGATATGDGTVWEYWDGTAWSSLTGVVDDTGTNSLRFGTVTGRGLVTWDLPTDWTQTNVTNEPAAIVKAYYVRNRVTNSTNYTAGPALETGWAGGEKQRKAVVRDAAVVTPAGATGNADYYLLGEPQTDFSDNDVFFALPSRKNGDINGAPTAQGPALATWFTSNSFPTISFTAQTFDVDDDGTSEYYAIDIDCVNNPLTEVYEWLKYILRNGGTTTGNSDGIEGEQYQGGAAVLTYTVNDAGDLAEGDYVTQETSGASGIIVSMDETGGTNYILLRDTRGTFATGATDHTVTNASTGSIEINTAAENFAANQVSPFGTFAGGVFFGARGVLLSNWVGADENSFQLSPLDNNGGIKQRPQAINLTVSNLVGTDETTVTDDRVAIFRLTGAGGQINKTEFSAFGGESIGGTTLDADTAAAADVPGKSTGGVVRIRDNSDNNQDYRLRFSSWANTGGGGSDVRFTLASFASFVTTATTNTTQITYATGGFNANVKRGDLVWNSTRTAHSYVKSVDSDTQLTIEPAIAGQVTGDSVAINVLPIAVNTADDIYVPLLDKYAAAGSESVSIVYVSPVNFRVVARNSANTTKIIPFVTDDATSGTDRSNSVVRNEDTIIT